MRASQLMAPTLREVPAEAEVASHILMLRAGMIRKAAAGVYTYLPLAYRTLKKIMQIVREEMDAKGGQELMLPVIQPAELWQESGRWDVYGDELFRLQDRHGRAFALGPTHEEIITDLVRGEVRSYKQLPLLLYQIQNKYRDERRPRFGLMRGREFIMKDLYSFDRDEAGLDISYQKMYDAYSRIFARCGLRFRPVEADSGAIGGSTTHEFMVMAESGEAAILYCDTCDYAANTEKAEACWVDEPLSAEMHAAAMHADESAQPAQVATPGARTIGEVAAFLNIPPTQFIKSLVFETEKETILVLVRGDREINEIKLYNLLGCVQLQMAGEETVRLITGAAVGFAGPIGIKNVTLVADKEVMTMRNAVTGSNITDVHLTNINPGRDFKPDLVGDIRLVAAGEPCPRCSGKLAEARGIEVGQVFKLGTKYSKALNAKHLDINGKEQLMVMGCYGVGVSRTMAAAIEQNHDENGIIWPVPIAPFQVVVVPVNTKDESQMKFAAEIYQDIQNSGVDVVLDDRNERPGVKFKDADLIGYPLRVTVGAKAVEEGAVEVRTRKNGETQLVGKDYVVDILKQVIAAEMAGIALQLTE